MQEQQVLSSRLIAMNKKLTLETKIRDAALSLSKANATYKNVNKQTSEQLDTANRKVELAQREVWRVAERAAEVQRKLLEHRAGVLSHSVRALERKNAPPDASDTSGYSTPNRSSQLSPVTASSATSIHTVSSKGRFEGAHFFAGHADAMLLHSPRVPPATPLPNGTSPAEMEEKLNEATAKQTALEQELSFLRLEKEQVETSLGEKLRDAEDSIQDLQSQVEELRAVQAQLQAMEEEREVWMNDRVELEEKRNEVEDLRQKSEDSAREVEELKRKVEELEERHGETAAASEGAIALAAGAHLAEMHKRDEELQDMRRRWEAERAAWDMEKATLMSEMNQHVVKLQQDVATGSGSKAQLDEVYQSLGSLAQAHGLEIAAGAAPAVVVAALTKHISDVKSQVGDHARAQQEWTAQQSQLEENARSLSEKCQALTQQLQDVQRERERAKEEVRSLEIQLEVKSLTRSLNTV